MPDEPVPAETYRVSCWSCRAKFDASTTRWCDCVTTERTRVCGACGRCFCKAPRAHKQEFWSGAPKALWDEKLVMRRRTDALMPRIDGRELCRKLKADPYTWQIPVIVMTSLYVSQKYRSEALQLGADEYLIKPLEHGQLVQVLGRFVPLADRGLSGSEVPA